MINSKKLTLVFEGLPLSFKHDVATLAATFLERPLLILRAAANSTHLALLLESSTRIRCETDSLRVACTYEKVRPTVSTGKLNVFERLTIDWPQKWPVSRTKLSQSCTNLMNGTSSIVDFCRQQPSQLRFIGQYQNSLLVYRQMTQEFKPLEKKRGHLIIAPSNSGKTTAACHILLKDKPFYVKDLTTVTFDQYCGQPGILIDDLNMHSPQLPILKNITNIIPARVNVKHGTLYVNFEIIVVTTQYSLLELTHDQELREALMSRFHFWTIGDSYSLLPV